MDSQEVHEKMINTAHYLRNANEKYNEYHLTPVSMAIIKKNLQTINAGKDVEKRNPLYGNDGNVN